MRVLTTSVLDFLLDLYKNPRSNERWTPPEWKPIECEGRVLGHLSEDAWRIVGMMRDGNRLFNERFEIEGGSSELHTEYLRLGKNVSRALSSITDAQIRLDLRAAGVSPEDAEYFCIRKDGAVIECVCHKFLSELGRKVSYKERPVDM